VSTCSEDISARGGNPVGRGDPIMARFLAWYYLWKEALVFNSDSIGMYRKPVR
jgi:hypothetical protein